MSRNGNLAPGVIVRTERLTKTFAGIEALAGLTIEVPEGAVFALIGPNGAGKTTAIKTIMNIFRGQHPDMRRCWVLTLAFWAANNCQRSGMCQRIS